LTPSTKELRETLVESITKSAEISTKAARRRLRSAFLRWKDPEKKKHTRQQRLRVWLEAQLGG